MAKIINQATSPKSIEDGRQPFNNPPAQRADLCTLAERVRDAILAKGYSALKLVRITVDDQSIVLHGPVRSYYLKQVAQETALAVEGVVAVRNEVEVVRRIRRPLDRTNDGKSNR